MVTNETAKMTYTVASGVTEYAIGFEYKTNPDGSPQIKVYKNKLSNTPLVYGVDYTLVENGTKIDVTGSVEVGDRLDIIRNIPMVQLSDYVIGRIDPEQIESDVDQAVMRDQQILSDLDFVAEVPEDHENRIQECESDIDDIESLIPNQATDENQLADKDFVNSSIATSTATFRGTYDTLAELEEVTADENDYGFVVSTDAAGNTLYSRYKYANGSWMFEYNLNNSSFTADQWAAINSTITKEIVDSLGATTGKNVGEIFFTLRNDNELRGAVECDGDTYSTTDFSGADAIGAKLEAGKVPYVSLSQYATLLSTNGSVGVFGWDGQGTTAFRVPTLNDIFIETGTVAQIGDYLSPKIPNLKGTLGPVAYSVNVQPTGIFYKTGTTERHGNSGNDLSYEQIGADASRASSVYDDSATTVQPNAVRYRAMIQLAVAATDEALETCTGVAADVASLKAHAVIEFQAPTAQNNYTWYRKYADGWVEQGGVVPKDTGTSGTITLPVEMANVYYTVTSNTGNNGANNFFNIDTMNMTVTTMDWYKSAAALAGSWQVSGMAATNN